MLKRALPFSLLVALFFALLLIHGWPGLILSSVVACVVLFLAVRELVSLFTKMGLCVHQFPAHLVAFSLFIAFFSHALFLKLPFLGPIYWPCLFWIVSGALAFVVLFIYPWFTFVRIGVDKDKIAGMLLGYLSGALIVIPILPLIKFYMVELPLEQTSNTVSIFAAPTILFIVACTKIGDTGAYLGGSLLSKLTQGKNHKIAPQISPNKSWEGCFFGMLFSIGMALLLGHFMPLGADFNRYPFFVVYPFLGMALFWAGYFGDLAESVLKRASQVKDSGALFPGMGGILDVLDSLFIAVPIYTFIFLVAKYLPQVMTMFSELCECNLG